MKFIPARRLPILETFLFFSLAVVASGAAAQTEASADKEAHEDVFSAETIHSDFRHLYEALQAAHADLYVHRSREAYDKRYQEVLASIDEPMSRFDVVRLFMPFVAYGRIGHAKIDFPVPDYLEYAQSDGTILPFDIRVDDGRVLIAYDYTDESVLVPGTELVALNGRPASEWLEEVSSYVSAERPYMTHAQLESMFPRLVWLVHGKIDVFRATVRSASGEETTLAVDAGPVMVVETQKSVWEAGLRNRKSELLPEGVAYLRPGPFYAQEEGETLETFEAFIDEAFRGFIEAGAQDLLIDLRGNPGGDNSFSDPMIAWFADKPFRFASRFEVKASPQTREVLEELAAADPGGLSAGMLKEMKKSEDGESFDFEIPDYEPRKDARFEGRVWTLIHRHSYSNATVAAAIIQDYGFGVVLGEETSDIPSSYASSAKFTLPETGIVVTYPKAYFARPSGDEKLLGVIPDHEFEFPIAPAGEGPVRQDVLEFIRKQRPEASGRLIERWLRGELDQEIRRFAILSPALMGVLITAYFAFKERRRHRDERMSRDQNDHAES